MIRILSLLLLAFSLSFGEVHYCLQLVSSTSLRDVERFYSMVSDLPDARVEKIGDLYTLRVGVFKSAREARSFLKGVAGNRAFRRAFVRRCANLPERIIYGDIGGGTNELFRLIASALLWSQRLEDALKVAKKGTELFPEDPYWWELYGDLLSWTGRDRSAVEVFIKAYELSGRKSLIKKAVNIAMAYGMYDVAMRYGEEAGLSEEEMKLVYEGSGDIDALINLLKEKEDRNSLLSLAGISLSIGELEEALNAIDRYVSLYSYDVQVAKLKAKVFISMKRFQDALDSLKVVMSHNVEDREFLRILSTLSWSIGDYDTSLSASLKLIELGYGHSVDYERAILILARKDPNRAFELSVRAWRELGIELFFERAVEVAYSSGMWKELSELVESHVKGVPEKDFILTAYITALSKLGRMDRLFDVVEKALSGRMSLSLLSHYIYLLIDQGEKDRLLRVLRLYRRYETSPEVAPAFVSAYVFLGMGDRAYSVFRQAGLKDPLLLSYVLDLMGMRERALNLRFQEFKRRRSLLLSRPVLRRDPEFMRDYLLLAGRFISKPTYEKMLMDVRQDLPEGLWREIYLSFLLEPAFLEKVEWLSKLRGYDLKPWMKMSFYLMRKDPQAIDNILREREDVISPADRAEALFLTHRIGKSFTVAFTALENNSYNYSLYTRLRGIALSYSNSLGVSSFYLSRRGYSEAVHTISFGFGRLIADHDLTFQARLMDPLARDRALIKRTPEGRYAELSLKRKNGLLKYALSASLLGRAVNTAGIGAEIWWSGWERIEAGFGATMNEEPEETIYLYLGGVKDRLFFYMRGFPRAGLTLSLSGEADRYLSYRREEVGKGYLTTGELIYRPRFSYPDIILGGYIQVGRFTRRDYPEDLGGVVPGEGFQIIPEDYESVALLFSVGNEAKYGFSRSIKPFASLDVGYNSRYGRLLSLTGGIAGRIGGSDRLLFEVSLSENAGAVQETILRVRAEYVVWF